MRDAPRPDRCPDRSGRLAGAALVLTLVTVAGCAGAARQRPDFASYLSETAAANVRQQSLGSLPYHPLVYHLDLSILAYQLYSQTLVWPFDPYYEEFPDRDGERARMMRVVRRWARAEGQAQRKSPRGLRGYRGPGVLSGFPDNRRHDPIIYQYSRLHPWSPSVTNADGTWVEYLTPPEITGRIRDVAVCYRPAGGRLGEVTVAPVAPGRTDARADATDLLLAFEGGTGDKGERGQPASQSLLGFALVRNRPDGGYDVHIAFRGSRSGSAARAARQALSDTQAHGNPDWITDMGTRLVRAPRTSTTGTVFRGFARSIRSTLPQIFRCLDHAARLKGSAAPANIYVTGHSLGGAMAQQLVSAILLGDSYGPGGEGPRMPASLRPWPWRRIKLITYGAPRIGDAAWAKTLTVEHLQSTFYASGHVPYDPDAIGVTEASVVPRLLDPSRPAAYRVLLPRDPVTTGKVVSASHVGQTVYLEEPSWLHAAAPRFSDHEPRLLRAAMRKTLRDARIPPTAWRYHAMSAFDPSRVEAERGTVAGYARLADAVRRYYRRGKVWFDQAAFDVGARIFAALVAEQ